MRKHRKPIEDFYAQHFKAYLKTLTADGVEISEEWTDNPDILAHLGTRRIAVELSQHPSDYIVKFFHKKAPPPTYEKDRIIGRRSIFPFEPHC